jgi:undecaprenyl-diphosphatase
MINLPPFPFDKQLLLYLNQFHWPHLDQFMVFLSNSGELALLWLVIALIFWFFDRKNGKKVLILLMLGLILEVLFNDGVLKHLFFRERPYLALANVFHLGPDWQNSSFVSGHTASSVLALIIFWRYYSTFRFPLLALCLLMIWTRIYLGMHYPSDIFGGIILGVFIAIILFKFQPKVLK